MRFLKIHGLIRRRLLVNFRVEPAVIQRLLPAPFRPKLHEGYAIAGICFIRLEDIRPKGIPQIAGLSSENAAHRIAVVWEDHGTAREGVYIPRRDTGSLINHLAGGRIFPGEHRRATFQVTDTGERIELHMRAADGGVQVDVAGHVAQDLPATSVFRTVSDASAFFEPGALGYSATADAGRLDGVALRTHSWTVAPLAIERAYSSYFADEALFPAGSVRFDCTLLMRNIPHEWQAAPDMHIQRSPNPRHPSPCTLFPSQPTGGSPSSGFSVDQIVKVARKRSSSLSMS
jgi:hypothetical protein